MTESFKADCVVIGAGVIGLACAREMSLAGRDVILLERHYDFGQETSSRNSGVIHAGIYYRPNSLKARLCVQGKALLYEFCEQRQIEYNNCGKLIVACNAEESEALMALKHRAIENGVDDLSLVSPSQSPYPELRFHSALRSPSTGVVDTHGVMQHLIADIEDNGGSIAFGADVVTIAQESNQIVVNLPDSRISAKSVINAAGLQATQLVKPFLAGTEYAGLSPRFARGHYFRLKGRSPFKELIYPMPVRGGLGVHLTLDTTGTARFGPDVEFIEEEEIDYSVDPGRAPSFYGAIRQYWPDLPDNSLDADYAGVRPKLSVNGELLSDFVVLRSTGCTELVHLLGIESPGLTSCLAMGKYVRKFLI
ncbi:MAG: NAD(P)/FAD-dependent oxidoreductase [Pseudomonadota bacterium]